MTTQASISRGGFTLIELLASMGILLIIVLIISRMFVGARMSWEVGSQRAEMNMRGRAVASYVANEMSMAVVTNAMTFSGDHASFDILGEANGAVKAHRHVQYTFNSGAGTVLRNGEAMSDGISAVVFDSISALDGTPLGASISITVTNDVDSKVFMSRAYFGNWNRNGAEALNGP